MKEKHSLKIIALHDAKAYCSCGRWDYSATGYREYGEILEQWESHHATPGIVDALANLLEFSNGKLGGNPYMIPEYAGGLRALAQAIHWKGDWMDTLEHYSRALAPIGRKLG
jgi:hypothetical protein